MEQLHSPYTAGNPHPAVVTANLDLDFGTIIKRWERLRIVYNAVLIPWVLAILLTSQTAPPGIVLMIVPAGILANLFYLLGPAVESYMTWFGFWHGSLTLLVFIAGLGFTALMALIAITQPWL